MENKPKYTPGPWKAEKYQDRIAIQKTSGVHIAQVMLVDDAALIAAAPELLEALKKLEARVDWFLSEDFGRALGINYNPLSQEFFDLEQARAAIAKAEGK